MRAEQGDPVQKLIIIIITHLLGVQRALCTVPGVSGWLMGPSECAMKEILFLSFTGAETEAEKG